MRFFKEKQSVFLSNICIPKIAPLIYLILLDETLYTILISIVFYCFFHLNFFATNRSLIPFSLINMVKFYYVTNNQILFFWVILPNCMGLFLQILIIFFYNNSSVCLLIVHHDIRVNKKVVVSFIIYPEQGSCWKCWSYIPYLHCWKKKKIFST